MKNLRAIARALQEAKRYAVLRGGTRSGKTYAALQFLVAAALARRFDLASVVSVSVPHLRRGALRDFRAITARLHIEERKSEKLFRFPGGSAIEFFSADQPAKLRGAQRDWLFVNEVNLIDEESFAELDVRTREFVIVDFNPTARFWLNEYLDRVEGAWLEVVSTYRDNPHLPPEQRNAIELRKVYEEWWRVYGEGEWGSATGQAWYSWEVGEWPVGVEVEVVGVDFGEGAAPTAVVGVARWGGGVVVKELAYGQLGLAQLAGVLKEQKAKLIVGDAAQRDMINQLRKAGVDIYPARKLQLIASYALLNNTRVIVDRYAHNLIKEAQGLEWADAGRGLLKAGQADHAVDALRYALHSIV